MHRRPRRARLGLTASTAVVLLLGAACGEESAPSATGNRPRLVVTTNIVGDLVENLVGDAADVEVIMPPDSNPHDFQASAQQAELMQEADVLITNGYGFEESLTDIIDAAEADDVEVYAVGSVVEPLELSEDAPGHEEEGDDEHADEEEGDDHGHEGEDPHWFTDPVRTADAVEALAEHLREVVPELDTEEFQTGADRYVDELRQLDTDVEAVLDDVPEERRALVTNHEVFAYFADRYDFEVIGAVIPGGSTLAEPSAAELDELSEAIESEGVPAIFAETSAPDRLVEALAREASIEVEVVELFAESLGEEGSGADSYVGMMTTNAERIADALGG